MFFLTAAPCPAEHHPRGSPAGDTGLVWEIDEYHGPFEGHATAEVELPEEDHPFPRPEWLGKEVTDDHRFSNLALALAQYWPGA